MALTRTQSIRTIKIVAIVVVAAGIIIYAIARSLAYVRGPDILVYEPVNGSTVASSTLEIDGRGERINSLDINGTPVSFSESGAFEDTIVVFPGVNVISLDATDQFRRTKHVELQVFGAVDLPAATPQAAAQASQAVTAPAPTSTAQTSTR